jgi:tRNA(adenine34) deaminase
MVHARIDALVYGARDPKIGAVASLAAPALAGLNHRFSVQGGVREEDCAALLREFFQARRHAAAGPPVQETSKRRTTVTPGRTVRA